jgi:hypothetical protein
MAMAFIMGVHAQRSALFVLATSAFRLVRWAAMVRKQGFQMHLQGGIFYEQQGEASKRSGRTYR